MTEYGCNPARRKLSKPTFFWTILRPPLIWTRSSKGLALQDMTSVTQVTQCSEARILYWLHWLSFIHMKLARHKQFQRSNAIESNQSKRTLRRGYLFIPVPRLQVLEIGRSQSFVRIHRVAFMRSSHIFHWHLLMSIQQKQSSFFTTNSREQAPQVHLKA